MLIPGLQCHTVRCLSDRFQAGPAEISTPTWSGQTWRRLQRFSSERLLKDFKSQQGMPDIRNQPSKSVLTHTQANTHILSLSLSLSLSLWGESNALASKLLRKPINGSYRLDDKSFLDLSRTYIRYGKYWYSYRFSINSLINSINRRYDKYLSV